MMSCPSTDELKCLMAETLAPERFAEVCEHIETCESCQNSLVALSQSDLPTTFFSSDPKDFLSSLAKQDPKQLFDATWKDVLDPPQSPEELGRLGNYAVLAEIGSGGMGVVFRSRDLQLQRQVAVKTIRPSLSIQADLQKRHELVNRFRREARMASALNHPNIVTIYEIGEHNGLAFIAMEFIEGHTLREQIHNGSLTLRERLHIGEQIADALAAAHDRGVLHRDLKPENVMIREDGLIKVLDFGLARPAAEDHLGSVESFSIAGAVIGTVSYMSPEQARGETLDVRSDIFSFGIILYNMLVGEHPFAYGSKTEIIAAILDRAPRPFGQLELPKALQHVMLQCLSKEPAQRPDARTIRNLLRELKDSTNWNSTPPSLANTGKSPDDSTLRSSFPHEATQQNVAALRPVRYAQSGDVNIAWQAIGDGPIDIVFVMGWVSHLDWFWKDPSFSTFLSRLSEIGRVILFDKRGTGLSDTVPLNELPTLEDRMDDVRAVMDAAGCEKAVLYGVSEGGPMCALFAATYPDKTVALIMNGSYARRLWAEDYPWGPTAAQREHFLQEIRESWGGPIGIEDRAPSMAEDPEFRSWWANYLRMGASPGAAVALTQMNAAIDIRGVLPNIQTPTLVIHRADDRCLLLDEGRYLANAIPGAKFVELPGADHLPFVGDSNAILNEIEEFLTGKRHAPEVDRVLATVVCIVVEQPEKMEVFQRHIECQADLFRGENLQIEQSIVHLTFDGPVRAVRAAQSLLHIGLRLGLNARYGVATGICDVSDHVAGPAVELSTRIGQKAPIAAVLVSEAVQNLTSGSGLEFVTISSLFEETGETTNLYQLLT